MLQTILISNPYVIKGKTHKISPSPNPNQTCIRTKLFYMDPINTYADRELLWELLINVYSFREQTKPHAIYATLKKVLFIKTRHL